MMRLHTTLCDLLGVEYPILQSGMGSVAGPDLVAEVSRAGGLGILGGVNVPVEDLRQRIRQVRAATDRPFGLNLWLHTELQPPADVTRIPDATVRAVQGTLNTFREQLGIPASHARPAPVADLIPAAFEMMLAERVPVWSIGLGNPGREMVAECRKRGIKVIAMVATADDARAVEAAGVDAIVAQGGEAGGHRSTWVKQASREAAAVGTMALIPQVVDAVRIPVIAAGGIGDGRGLIAALALGAAGVLLGTRFVATRESMAPAFYKKSLLELDADATTITDAFSGLYARTLRNSFTEGYRASGAPVLPALVQSNAAQDVFVASAKQETGDYFPMWSGQVVGLIHNLPGAADVVETIVREAHAVLAALPRRVQIGDGSPRRGERA